MAKPLMLLTPVESAECCAPLSREPMTAEQSEQIAPLLKALADPVRLRLMSLVASHDGGEACVCDLADAFELSQPTISHHLRVLTQAGLVHRTSRGTWAWFSINEDGLRELSAVLS